MGIAASLRVGYILKVFPRLSETFILNEILELERQGVEVHIFSLKPPTDPRFHGELASLRASVTYLPRADSSEMWRAVQESCRGRDFDVPAVGQGFLHALKRQDSTSLQALLQAFYLAAAARSRGLDHLHAHFATSATHAALLAHVIGDISFSFTAHAKDIYHRDRDQALLREALERCAFAVTVTAHNVGELESLAPGARGKVRLIYNGVALDRLNATPAPANGDFQIVSVGRLVEKKGFNYLLEACRLLADRGRRLRCTIVGGGPLEAALRDQIEQLRLQRIVTLTGAQAHDAAIEQIGRGHLLVLPCIVGEDGNRDALPTVLLEAMALGRPAVSTDLPGVTEIVEHGRTGLLAPQRDAAALADAMDHLAADASLRAEYGRAARTRAERLFSLERNVSELARLFRATAAPAEAVADQRSGTLRVAEGAR